MSDRKLIILLCVYMYLMQGYEAQSTACVDKICQAENYAQKIGIMEEKLETNALKIKFLEEEMTSNERKIKTLEDEINSNTQKNNLLEQERNSQAQQITLLGDNQRSDARKIQLLEQNEVSDGHKMRTLEAELNTLKQGITQVTNTVAALSTSEPIISFVARFPPGIGTYRNSQTVKFTSVIENLGDGYNPQTGIFTCPVTGIYNFGVKLMTGDTYFEFTVYRDSQSMAVLLCNPDTERTTNKLASDSASVSFKCTRGQTVSVVLGTYPGNLSVDLHSKWNVFSGVLIRKI